MDDYDDDDMDQQESLSRKIEFWSTPCTYRSYSRLEIYHGEGHVVRCWTNIQMQKYANNV
jgi:hypothetical protein